MSDKAVYHLTEDQHDAIYQARHVCELMSDLASCRDNSVEVNRETLAVVGRLVGDLLDKAVPGLVFYTRLTNSPPPC